MDVVVAWSGARHEEHVDCERQHVVGRFGEHSGDVGLGAVHLVRCVAVEHGHWRVTSRKEETGMVRSDGEGWKAF